MVLLDLQRDRYLALDAAESGPLALVVAGWPTLSKAHPAENAAGDADKKRLSAFANARAMVRDGLLTPEPPSGRAAAHAKLVATVSLLTMPARHLPAIRARHVFAFLWALAVTLLELKVLPIQRVVERFRIRREYNVWGLHRPHSVDLGELQGFVSIFFRLQPFFFGSHDACMLHSLALARFLLRFGFSTRWVFGVQDAPFGAHCWLAHDCTLVNDTLERVRGYTPILEV